MKCDSELYLEGAPISEGVAIGKLYAMDTEEKLFIPEFSINSEEVDHEISRYRNAISSSRNDLVQLQSFLSDEGSNEAVSIIDTHIQMLEDPLMTTFVEKKIRSQLQNTETVFRSVMGDYERQFSARGDQFFQQRLIDVKDLSQRIMKHLHPIGECDHYIPRHAVICAKELVPSDTAEACISKVSAFISEIGGVTSHAALIARAKGIPFVANIDFEKLKEFDGSLIIVDGTEGKIIINPSKSTLQSYEAIKEDIEMLSEELDPETQSLDGVDVGLYANIENVLDMDHIHFRGAQGIGLFRSEFLFLQDNLFTVSEEDQFILYLQILNKAKDLPVTFRVFDFGSDKGLAATPWPEESNPALGCRAIRFLLNQQGIFRRQLRAILRASQYGRVKLMFPLIIDLQEYRKAKNIVYDVMDQLKAENVAFDENISIGCMIEVPSAALTSDSIAKEADFLSIGTNDLVQYMLAIDRANPTLTGYYQPAHPSILKLIKFIVENGVKQNAEVYVCGEMASSPLFTELLLGLGIRNLSCAPRHIPWIKKMVQNISVTDSKDFATQLLSLQTSEEIEKALKKRYEKYASI